MTTSLLVEDDHPFDSFFLSCHPLHFLVSSVILKNVTLKQGDVGHERIAYLGAIHILLSIGLEQMFGK